MRQGRLPTPPSMASIPLILGRSTVARTSGLWWGAALELGVGGQGPSSPSIPSSSMLLVKHSLCPGQGLCSLVEWAPWQWEASVLSMASIFDGSETCVGWQVTLNQGGLHLHGTSRASFG